MAAHQHWRLYFTLGNHVSFITIATLEFRATAGGADQCSGGTASASGTLGGQPSSNAFDGSAATYWSSNLGPTVPGAWLRYSFAAPVTVTQVAITLASGGQYLYSPNSWDVQYSDDGTAWTTAWSASGQTNNTSVATITSTEGAAIPSRVTAQSVEVLSESAASARVTAQSLEVLVGTYEVRVMKAVGYAVLTSTGNRIGLQKAVGYAILDSTAVASVRKAIGYAVLFDTTVSTSDRRKPVIAFCS